MDIDNVLDEMKCRDYQKDAARKTFECFDRTNSTLVVLPTGCHTASQGILMFDGTIKRADSIETGDQLMGPDSTPRTVLQTVRGVGRMLDIVPTKGDTWRVNEDHVLSLIEVDSNGIGQIEVSVSNFLKWPETWKNNCKQYRIFPLIPGHSASEIEIVNFYINDPCVVEMYYGWTVDKDNLYLLEDFTVTHNCGKTHVASSICKVWEHQKRGRILWVAHRKELIEQAANSIFRLTGEHPAIEMADNSSMEWGLLKRSSIVVASIQTLMSGRKCSTCEGTGGVLEPCDKCDGKGCDDPKCEKRGTVPSEEDCPHCLGGRRRRLQKFRPDEFTLVVIDECHHATASTYRRVTRWMQQNKQAKLLGLTATPDRADESALGCVFKSIAANIDMPWAIANGWLVPITQKSITCEHLDFSNIRTTAGDLNQKDLEELLINEESLHEMVAPTVELAGDRKTLVFCVDKNHTKLVCELINRYKPTSARYILGCTSDTERDQNFKDHKAGAFQFLVNCGVTTEGYDDPAIQVVAIMRPTKSRSLYVQMCGRGTRPIDPPIEEIAEQRVFAIQTSEKPEVLILDYVGNSGRHKLITSFDLFDGTYPPNVLDRAKRISEQAEEELPTEEVIKRAARELEEEEKKRIEEEERKRREFLKAKAARYVSQSIDPFAWWDTLPDRFATPTQGEPASDAQTGALSRMGVEPFRLSNITSKQASVMLKTLAERKEKGLASYKQSKILKKNGMSPDVTFKQAGAIIDALKRNNWRMNDYIRSMAPVQATASAE